MVGLTWFVSHFLTVFSSFSKASRASSKVQISSRHSRWMLPCFISSSKKLALRSRRSTEWAASAGRNTERRAVGGGANTGTERGERILNWEMCEKKCTNHNMKQRQEKEQKRRKWWWVSKRNSMGQEVKGGKYKQREYWRREERGKRTKRIEMLKKKQKRGEGERWGLKQRLQSRAKCCPVPTFLHKNKSSFDLGIHPWATEEKLGEWT